MKTYNYPGSQGIYITFRNKHKIQEQPNYQNLHKNLHPNAPNTMDHLAAHLYCYSLVFQVVIELTCSDRHITGCPTLAFSWMPQLEWQGVSASRSI